MKELPKRPSARSDSNGDPIDFKTWHHFYAASAQYNNFIAREAIAALERIMHARRNPAVMTTDMSRAGMRELAGETLEKIKASGWLS